MFKKNISSLHLPHNKNTAECVPVKIDAPEKVILPMDMHSGGLAEPVVSVGDYVRVGQLIAKEAGRFSSPVHATVSGKVIAIEPMLRASGKEVLAIHIENDGKMEIDPSVKAPVINNCDEFLQALRDSGIVGLGGAAFPTWAKLNEMRNDEYTVDTVLVNAAECEPYITCDFISILENAKKLIPHEIKKNSDGKMKSAPMNYSQFPQNYDSSQQMFMIQNQMQQMYSMPF